MRSKKQFLFYFFITSVIIVSSCRTSDCGCPMAQNEYEDTSPQRNILVKEL